MIRFFKKSRSSNRMSERGITLIETLLVLAVGAAILIAFAQAITQRTAAILESSAAAQLKEVGKGVKSYVDDNYIALRDNAPQTIAPIDIKDYLPPNLNRDAFGQTYSIVTRAVTTGGVRTGVEALVVAGNATRALTDTNITGVAALAGANAGFFSQGKPPLECNGHQICGAYGFFAIDTLGFNDPGFAKPTVVSYVEANNGDIFADYLYRVAVPGQPQLNRMATDLDMDGHNINKIGNANFLNGGRVGEAGGQLRLSSGGGTVEVAGTDGSAQDLAVSGDVTIQGRNTACVGGVSGCGQIVSDVGGLTNLNNNYLNLQLFNGGSSGVKITGGVKDGIIDVADVYMRGKGWLTDMLPNYVAKYGYIVGDNTNLAKPACPTGQSARIIMSPHFFNLFIRDPSSPNNNVASDAAFQMYAVDYGTYWQTRIKTYRETGEISAGGGTARAVAMVYCYRP